MNKDWESKSIKLIRSQGNGFTKWFLKWDTTQIKIYPKTYIGLLCLFYSFKKVIFDWPAQKRKMEEIEKHAINKGKQIIKKEVTRNGKVDYDRVLYLSKFIETRQLEQLHKENQLLVEKLSQLS
jgi:hypothetical protein